VISTPVGSVRDTLYLALLGVASLQRLDCGDVQAETGIPVLAAKHFQQGEGARLDLVNGVGAIGRA